MTTPVVTALRGLVGALGAALVLTASPAAAEDETVAKLRAADRKTFSDREIISGFVRLMFNPELPFMGRVDRVRKFDGPVRVHVDTRANPDRTEQLREVVADIAARIQNLDIAVTEHRRDANLTVTLISDRDLPRIVRALQRRKPDRAVQRSLHPRCLLELRRDDGFRVVRSEAVITTDAGEFAFYDCTYEKLLRALGPINDDLTLSWSTFNSEVRKGFFGVYDQYLLNMLYDRRIRPGMTEAQAQPLLPEVLRSVRPFVARLNKLPR
ncbi:MAG TPA: DUF2927 domain-containing protein [Xanthobacteraceae bacterium]|nr:DUF2927 domain-containing protein [Xanthobacteraceae bacterium]